MENQHEQNIIEATAQENVAPAANELEQPQENDSQVQTPAEQEKPKYLTAAVRRKKKQRKGGLAKRQRAEIMNDPEKRAKSKKMGVIAIVLCVLSMALCYPTVWLAVQIVVHGVTHFYYIIGNIVVVGFGLLLPVLLFMSQIYHFVFSISQLKIRKDWFGWVCLVLSIITVLAVIVLSFLSLKPVLDGLAS